MGADFVALIPSTSTGMGYGYVHTIRCKLVSMVDKELGRILSRTSWSSGSGMIWDIIANNYNTVTTGINQMICSLGPEQEEEADILRGVLAFVDHSDCDGTFEGEECEWILKALKKLQDTNGDEVVERLIKVFDDAVSSDGIVAIW